MKKALQNLTYHLLYGLWYALSLLPMRVLYALSDVLALASIHIIRYRRKVIRHNLETAFPEKTAAERQRIAHDFYRWFCDYLVETVKMMSISADEFRRRMRFENTEEIDAAVASGRSVAVYLGHYGNWEWITSLPLWITKESQCCELYHPLENAATDRLFLHVRQRYNALCIPMEESLRKMVAFRRQGRPLVVGYIADQAPLWWNIHHWRPFLNHDTPVLTGAERIVKHTDQMAFYGDMQRTGRGHYTCTFKCIAAEPKLTGQWEITDRYFELLEESIRRDPACWLWSHNRWKRTRETFNRYWVEKDGKVVRNDTPDEG